MKITFFAVISASLCVSVHALAVGGFAVEFDSPGVLVDGNTTPMTVGWEFTVTSNSILHVLDLGYYDHNSDGFGQSHEVGIWESDGTLLTSTTITNNNSILLGHFRYTAINGDIHLEPGHTYMVGAVSGGHGGSDFYTYDTTGFNVSPVISYNGARWQYGDTLSFMSNSSDVQNGFFGATFSILIPTPCTLALLGISGLAVKRRRR